VPLAVDRQEGDGESVLALTRRLVRLRKRCEALRLGALRRVEAPEPLLAFERGEGRGALLCAFNLGDQPADWPLPAGWRIAAGVNGGEDGRLPPLAGWIAERG
jgi:alpha-glucosidase